MKRQIVLDTETTGLEHKLGHRMIEIGCLEMLNRRLTGRTMHFYLNPDRIVDEEALKVHGINNEFLQDKPRFFDVVDELMEFLRGSELIIHNAEFDVGFINAELALLRRNHYGLVQDHCEILDTLALARQLHPGQRNSLDALCKRYQINNSHRKLHGALLDADILARVFLSMTGGQKKLFAEEKKTDEPLAHRQEGPAVLARTYNLRLVKAGETERALHEAYINKLRLRA